MWCGHAVDWTGGGGEEEDRGRRGDEEMRRRGLHVHLLTRDEGGPEESHRQRRRQGLAEGRGKRGRDS
jgi:hypothetical protein